MTEQTTAASLSREYRPIGWYLKEADRLITQEANAAFAKKGITRFHWQILNTVNEAGTANPVRMYPGVRSFVTEEQLRELFQSLIERGWLRPADENAGDVVFWDKGREEFSEIVDIQREFFGRLMNGLSKEEYEGTIRTIIKMIENLGGAI